MKMALLFPAILSLALSGCVQNTSQQHLPSARQDVSAPHVDIPGFTIKLILSPAAQAKLQGSGERISVLAMFDGDALPGQRNCGAPNRDVCLGSSRKLVETTNVVRFDDARIPKRDYDRLRDKNFFVTINVFTARRVFKDNLLDCDEPIDVRIDVLRDKTTEARCWLIGEPDSPITRAEQSDRLR